MHPPPTWTVLVPVKGLDAAKSRLGPAQPDQRSALALAFAADVVLAARRCPAVGQVLVVTDDDRAAAQLAPLGASISRPAAASLNAALRAAAADLPAGSDVAALVADLPALREDELGRALAAATPGRSFVSDAAGTGTTLLMARHGHRLDPHFGNRSRAAHTGSGAVELPLDSVAGLRRDVDTEIDLADARRLGVGRHTAALLDV
ncbi:MAG: 2-phospho-L-lactate guanylyltransferase [Actinomycetota bacterium]|nr:MAG: 2-phospho-L-lactate guanylyltransferase [Actinomycetota bacterium]